MPLYYPPFSIPTTQGSDQTIYVATTGNDTTGTGASGAPYLTIARALRDIPTVVTARYTIDIADGTYREQVNLDRFVFPSFGAQTTDARIIIDGNTATPANVVISGADSGAPTTPVRAFCIRARNAFATIQGVKVDYSTTRGIQLDGYSDVTLGAVTYDNCGDGLLLSEHSKVIIAGTQTISNVANGIYLTERARLNSDSGSRTITMTAITNRGLYVVEADALLNSGDTISITAHSSGTRSAGIEADGNAVVDVPVTVTVSGAFVYSVVATAGSRIHIASASATISGASTAAYITNEDSSIWDTTNSGYLSGHVSCRVRRTTSQAITNATDTAILFDAEDYDPSGMHSTVSNTSRVTIQETGTYIVTGALQWPANTTGLRQCWIRADGTTSYIGDRRSATLPNDVIMQQVGDILRLTAGQYLELVVHQTSGGSLSVDRGAAPHATFAATRIA